MASFIYSETLNVSILGIWAEKSETGVWNKSPRMGEKRKPETHYKTVRGLLALGFELERQTKMLTDVYRLVGVGGSNR